MRSSVKNWPFGKNSAIDPMTCYTGVPAPIKVMAVIRLRNPLIRNGKILIDGRDRPLQDWVMPQFGV